MKIDAEGFPESPAESAGLAKKAEELGFDCVWFNETKHDPFVQLALAATVTSKINVGTSIALAFTRSPTTLAYSAWDIQSLSRGRLILGLGTQVKGHIERRFGLKWESPAPKMKEVIQAIRAVWNTWETGEKLDYHGRFFQLNLMTPFFDPGPIAWGKIPVYVAGVNEGMCRLAGRHAEGLHVHPLHTMKYLRDVVDPALREGARAAGRKRSDISVAASVFAAVGDESKEVKKEKEALRDQIAFYASTRTYGSLMRLHGWGDISERLHELSVKGDWGKMASLVPDEVLDEFVVEGNWDEIGKLLEGRYGEMIDRVRLYRPFDGTDKWRRLVAGFRPSR